ncbi:nuclear factor 7, ovary-like [Pholidichthys leucotaenia]
MSLKSEMDLSCSVCHDIFRNPVTLCCSHSFCKDCLQMWWKEKKEQSCPLCKKIPLLKDPPVSLALKNVCDTFREERERRAPPETKAVCPVHLEKLKLFCMDHQEPACLVCRDSKSHISHKFRPLEEAAQELREKLNAALKSLQEKLKLFKFTKDNCDLTVEHNRVQAQQAQTLIRLQFKKLHQFLKDEEEARLIALKEEEKQKNLMLEKKIEDLNSKITALSETIKSTEMELKTEDSPFVHGYNSAEEKIQQCNLLQNPEMVSGTLIDMTEHLGNLTFKIWDKMKEAVSYTPVILDPNTAHPNLHLSEDLTCVRSGERQNLPQNPERFDNYSIVLGSEGLKAGTHSWDIEVSNDGVWCLGVIQETARRKGRMETGFWEFCFYDGKYTIASPPQPRKTLSVKDLRRVRVQLDYDKGKLSFFNPDTNTLIHVFKEPFTETLFPYFETKNQPLTVLPVTVSAMVEENKAPAKRRGMEGPWGRIHLGQAGGSDPDQSHQQEKLGQYSLARTIQSHPDDANSRESRRT